jgi:hypothetical protein
LIILEELLEQTKQSFPTTDEYLLWLSVVDYHVREDLKLEVPENSALIDLFQKELEMFEY